MLAQTKGIRHIIGDGPLRRRQRLGTHHLHEPSEHHCVRRDGQVRSTRIVGPKMKCTPLADHALQVMALPIEQITTGDQTDRPCDGICADTACPLEHRPITIPERASPAIHPVTRRPNRLHLQRG